MSFRRPNQKTQTNEKFSDKKRAGKIPVEAAYPKHKAGQTQTKDEVQTKANKIFNMVSICYFTGRIEKKIIFG